MSAEIYRRKYKRKLLYLSRKIEDGDISDDEAEEVYNPCKKKLKFQNNGENEVFSFGNQFSSPFQVVKPLFHSIRDWSKCAEEFVGDASFIERLPALNKTHNSSWISHSFKSDKEEEFISVDCTSSDRSELLFQTPEKNSENGQLDDIDSVSSDLTIPRLGSTEEDCKSENIDFTASGSYKCQNAQAEEETVIESRESRDELSIYHPDSSSQHSLFAEHFHSLTEIQNPLSAEVIPVKTTQSTIYLEEASSESSPDISHHSSPMKIDTTGLKGEQWLKALQWYPNAPEQINNNFIQDSGSSTEGNINFSISPSPNKDSTHKLKVTQWLQTIQCQLKTPKHDQKDSHLLLESAKKKKYISGGLAERAVKLAVREKSSKHIWRHQRSHSAMKEDESNVLTLRIIHSICDGGLVIAGCKEWEIMKNDVEKESTHSLFSNHLSQSYICVSSGVVQNEEPQPLVKDEDSEVCLTVKENCQVPDTLSTLIYKVLISIEDFIKLKLSTGSVIKIHPPWQKMNLMSTSEPVILCTRFIEVLNSIPNDPVSTDEGISQKEEVLYQWNCLCRSDSSIQPRHCPGVHVDIKYGDIEKEKRITGTNESSNKRIKSHKTEDDASTPFKKFTMSKSESSHFERNPQNPKGLILPLYGLLVGSLASNENVAICGIVQRVWWFSSSRIEQELLATSNRTSTASKIRLCVLLQDAEGSFCEVHLPTVSLSSAMKSDSLEAVIHNGEGHAFWFSDIRITHRQTNARHSALFSVLKEIHRQQKKRAQGNQEEFLLQPYCYALTANHWESKVSSALTDSLPLYCPPNLQSLKEILLDISKAHRFSFAAKVIWRRGNILYITDSSLANSSKDAPFQSYAKLLVCFESIRSATLNSKLETAVIVVSDCKFNEGILTMDMYSGLTILTPFNQSTHYNYSHLVCKESLEKLQLNNCSMKKVTANCKIGDLVKIEGIITGVNEETALSWLECEHCHSQDLIQETKGEIYCEKCKQSVLAPIFKINLEVLIECPEYCQIKLLEATAFTLLPKPVPGSLQPTYTVSDILNKKLGPIVCSVEDLQYNHAKNLVRLILSQVA